MIALSPVGVVESLSQGFAVVNRRPWLIAIPLALNVLLWLGPTVTAGPLVQTWMDGYQQLLQEYPGIAQSQGRGADELLGEAARLSEAASKVNLLRVLAFQVPSLIASVNSGVLTWEIAHGSTLLLTLAGLLLLGLYGAAAYLSGIADAVRAGGVSLQSFPRRVWSNWLHLLGYYGVLLGIALPVMIGVSMLFVITRLISEGLANFLLMISLGLAMMVQFYLFFALPAMFVGQVGPLRAIWQSALVMGRFFWSGLGFIVLNWVIGTGFTLIFGRVFDFAPLGSTAAVVGHAYISTGLAAAAMVFYRNRALLATEARTRSGAPIR